MLGRILHGRYNIIEVLGAGGFGQTYLAEDTSPSPVSRLVVVKHFKPASQESYFLGVARRLFTTEVNSLKRLGQHDQIPELFDSFEEDGNFFLVQEFIDGHPLSDELAAEKRLDEAETIALLRDVLVVLDFVHTHHVIHRDIKPGNLIRRHRDHKIVLIDFGAVKEIGTQLTSGTGQTKLTVGIGTHGYTPSEQLAGKPRYCSDIYALGITAIQALTGLQPSQLAEDPDTSEIIWQDWAHVSTGLALILSKMVRFQFQHRFQSAQQVLDALQRLSELPTDMTEMPLSFLLNEDDGMPLSLIDVRMDWQQTLWQGCRNVAIATLATTSLITGVRYLSWLQPLELATYDQMTRIQPELPPDPRLLVVAITEADLQKLQRSTPADAEVAQVVQQLQQYNPAVIGVDLYRDLPQPPGTDALLRQLQANNVVSIRFLGTSTKDAVPPPPGIPEEQVGFNDFPIDADDVVRRSLIFASDQSRHFYSFAMQLALTYLKRQGIAPQNQPAEPDKIQFGQATFLPLSASSGGYQTVEDAGYQILLDYRSANQVAQQVSFVDVLNGKINPDWVKDKIVLIGTTAPSSKDLFNTPFSATKQDNVRMAGVIIHAQMTSQLLTAVLDGKGLFWFIPDWVEIAWIAGWATLGGAIAWFIHHPLLLGLSEAGVLLVLSGTTLMLFTYHGWMPLAAPLIATVINSMAIATYRSYQNQRQQQQLTRLLLEKNS